MRKTLEAQGDPLKGALPTLQTSLTLPELPCTATAGLGCKDFLRFQNGGCRAGKFLVCREVRILCRVRLRTRLASGVRLESMPCTSAEIPPAGAPSGFDGTPQAFALK